MKARPRDQRPEAGGAVIELMLTAPILLLIILVMFDFAQGYRVSQEGERASRHAAWAEARSRENSSHPGAGSTSVHYRSRGSTAGRSTGTASEHRYTGLGGALYGAAAVLLRAFDFNRVSRGALDYLGGLIEYTEAETGFRPSGLRILPRGTVRNRHAVSLDPRREADPRDPEGWWDPFHGEGGLLRKLRAWGGLPW